MKTPNLLARNSDLEICEKVAGILFLDLALIEQPLTADDPVMIYRYSKTAGIQYAEFTDDGNEIWEWTDSNMTESQFAHEVCEAELVPLLEGAE